MLVTCSKNKFIKFNLDHYWKKTRIKTVKFCPSQKYSISEVLLNLPILALYRKLQICTETPSSLGHAGQMLYFHDHESVPESVFIGQSQ